MKKFLSFSLILFLVLGLSISAGAQELEKKILDDMYFDEIGEYGGTFTLSTTSAPESFNPYGSLDAATYTVALKFLDALVEQNQITKELSPGLASDWEVSDDGKEVIFHLREGVQWSDGHYFDAEDVIFTFENFIYNKNAERNLSSRYKIGPDNERIEFKKVDKYTVKAELPVPYGAFTRVLAQALIVPEHKLEKYVDSDNPGKINEAWTTDTDLEEIVGTGPVILSEYQTDQKIVLKRNPHSWRYDPEGNQLPYVDNLEYLIVKDFEVEKAKFRSGELDAIYSISGQDYPSLKQLEVDNSDFKVLAGEPINPTPSPVHLSFNFDTDNEELKEVFRNIKFREAMAYIVNREKIIEDVFNTLAIKPGTPVLPAHKEWYNPKIEELRRGYDLDKARELLNDIGITDSDGDGVREFENGDDFEFVLTLPSTSSYQDSASVIIDAAEEVGIKITRNVLNHNLALDKGLNNDFEALMMAFGNQPDPQLRKEVWQPGQELYYFHSSITDEDRNINESEMYDWEQEVYNIFEKGQTSMDNEVRKGYYDRWQEIFSEKLPVIFLYKEKDVKGFSNDFSNYFLNEDGVIVGSYLTIFKK
ncbi:MAG: ABC transporter substrate-binding protein [bacterium]